MEIGLIYYSPAIINWNRQNCRPRKDTWTLRERENQAPFWKKSGYQGKSRSLQEDNGPKKSNGETGTEPQAAREEVEWLKKDSENLKREAWG